MWHSSTTHKKGGDYIMRALLLVISTYLALSVVSADAEQIKPTVDVMVALDNSGSMKKNDPKRLLKTVVRDFARRLGPTDRLGVVVFDQGVHVAMALTPLGDAGFGDAIDSVLTKIDYTGRLTDIPRGLEHARYELDHSRRVNARQIVILLTDGEVDLGSPDRNSEAKRYLRETVIPDTKGSGIKVFGITLTEEADVALIQGITQATGGDYYKLLQADEIPEAFNRIFTRLQALRETPIEVATQKIDEAVERLNRQREQEAKIAAMQQKQRDENDARTNLILGGLGSILLLSVFWVVRRKSLAASLPKVRLVDINNVTGTAEYPLDKTITRIGRVAGQNEIVIPPKTISTQHASIRYVNDKFLLEDLRSTNGTYLNGKKLSDEDRNGLPLKHGDLIRFGPAEFRFQFDALENQNAARLQTTVLRDGEPVSRGTARMAAPQPETIAKPNEAAATLPKAEFQNDVAVREPTPDSLPKTSRKPTSPSEKDAFCAFHEHARAVAVCAKCGSPICDFENPVETPDGGKVCAEMRDHGTCPNYRTAT